MPQIERRALYNLLRMNWLQDSHLQVEPWQVEDLRLLNPQHLFERLKQYAIDLDRISFVAYADQCESPEELTDYLIGDRKVKADIEDRIYLITFELWRRLVSEKPSISILCDELDYQIYLYDNGQLHDLDDLQNALNNFLSILDENVDEGIDPKEAFQLVSNFCANDIETFLYDFISEQIDQGHESCAHELLDGFADYFEGNKWFALLRAHLAGHSNPKVAHKYLSQILEDHLEERDLEFNLELLSSMIDISSLPLFQSLVRQTTPLLEQEQDFHDLITICADYYHRLDNEAQERKLQSLLEKRSQDLEKPLNANDPGLAEFSKLIG